MFFHLTNYRFVGPKQAATGAKGTICVAILLLKGWSVPLIGRS